MLMGLFFALLAPTIPTAYAIAILVIGIVVTIIAMIFKGRQKK